MRCVAIIPARGGSVRIPRKNIKNFFGKPIIAYSIEAARASKLFDGGIWVSTEDPEIALVARKYGAGVIHRPLNLAEFNGAPDPGTQEVTRHAIEWLQRGNLHPEYVCCIYPCSPFLQPIELAVGLGWIEHTGPAYSYVPGTYYWGKAKAFIDRVSPLEDSIEATHGRNMDINTPEEWTIAERLYGETLCAS